MPYFSYGEPLPVLTEGTTAPGSLGYTLGTLAQLLAGRLSNAEEIVTGDSMPAKAESSLPALTVETEAVLARMDPELSRQVWQALCRMVRVDARESDQTGLRPDSLDVTLLRDESVERQLTELPVVRVSGETAVWVDDAVVMIWPALKSRVEQRRDFLAWAQSVRQAMTRSKPVLTGAALVDALAWRRDHWSDLIPAEREHIDLSEAKAKKEQRANERVWVAISMVVCALEVAGVVLASRFAADALAGLLMLLTLVTAMVLVDETREHRRVIRESPRDPARLRERIVEMLRGRGYRLVSGDKDRLLELQPRSRLGRVRIGAVYLVLHRDGDRTYLIVSTTRSLMRQLAKLDDELAV